MRADCFHFWHTVALFGFWKANNTVTPFHSARHSTHTPAFAAYLLLHSVSFTRTVQSVYSYTQSTAYSTNSYTSSSSLWVTMIGKEHMLPVHKSSDVQTGRRGPGITVAHGYKSTTSKGRLLFAQAFAHLWHASRLRRNPNSSAITMQAVREMIQRWFPGNSTANGFMYLCSLF